MVRVPLIRVAVVAAIAAALLAPVVLEASSSEAAVVAPGLTSTPVLTGLPTPTAARFTPSGGIFVANKRGDVWYFDGPGDTSPVTALDLRTEVYDNGDRGLLGLALDPGFERGRPYLYALYSYDRDPFGATTVPRWGSSAGGDTCPSPPGQNTDGCTSSARLERFVIKPDHTADLSTRLVLLDGAASANQGWCSQFDSHSIGTVAFGPDGALYVGAGDGAGYNVADYGQLGGTSGGTPKPTPANPCNDRPGQHGTALSPATSSGGALRAQAVRTATGNDPVSWDGAILRISPDSGAALPDNPLVGNGIANDDRIVAYGLRNPFRFAFRPGSNELWLGDVGWFSYDEIDAFTPGPGQKQVPNFGWPCVEGPDHQFIYAGAGLGLCDSLYANATSSIGGVTSPLVAPYFSWDRSASKPAAGCATNGGGAAIGGQFVTGSTWPAALQGAYVFSDYARGCIVALPRGANGQPDTNRPTAIATGVTAVDLQPGPGGDLYYTDIASGSVQRLRSTATNVPPVARFTATPSSGPLPLTVTFDASTTTDANQGEVLTYTWDLDGDGQCDDATGVTATRTYTAAAPVLAKLCAADQLGATGTTTQTIFAGGQPPTITALTSSADANGWAVGDTITLHADATGAAGTLPDRAFAWSVSLRHCTAPGDESACHTHPVSAIPSGRTTTLVTPDHDYYAYLQATLTVTGAEGATATRTLDLRPRLAQVALTTEPAGIPVSVGIVSGASPRTATVLEGGVAQAIVPATATVAGVTYTFAGWSDGSAAGPQRQLTAAPGTTQLVARYDRAPATGPTITAVKVDRTSVVLSLLLPQNLGIGAHVEDPDGVTAVRFNLTAANGTTNATSLWRWWGSTTSGDWTGGALLMPYTTDGDYTTSFTATDRTGATTTIPGPAVRIRHGFCLLLLCF